MDWLHHPRYSKARDRALGCLASEKYRFRRLQPVLFLCGGLQSLRRIRLAEYIRRHHSDVMVFYAEDVWSFIASQPGVNALEMEGKLAELADMVVVIVESPGTFAELGAFAISGPLRQKMLPILDSKHRHCESFLRTGPVRWVDADSQFGPSIWTPLDSILAAAPEVDERIARIPPTRAQKVTELGTSQKHLLFFICDLVTVFGPCSTDHLRFYLSRLVPNANVDMMLVLGLGQGLRLIRSFRLGAMDFHFRPLQDGGLPTFQTKRRYVDIPTLRAEILGAMQACDPCREALSQMGAQP